MLFGGHMRQCLMVKSVPNCPCLTDEFLMSSWGTNSFFTILFQWEESYELIRLSDGIHLEEILVVPCPGLGQGLY